MNQRLPCEDSAHPSVEYSGQSKCSMGKYWRMTYLFPVLLTLAGCGDPGPPPVPTDPVSREIQLPSGIPNDRWFHEHIFKSDVPVLIDFTATWCPPCRAMKPELEKVEAAYGQRLKVVPIDVDEHSYLTSYFQVTGIPRLMVMQDGVIKADQVGGLRYQDIVDLVAPVVGSP